MKRITDYIMKRLTLWLGFAIVILVAVIFTIAISFLFSLSKDYVVRESEGRATQILDNTALRITDIMSEVETTADNMAWYIANATQPDSLIRNTRKILQNNDHFYSCSISMEPYYFKQYGKYFSIYSVRDGDSISTAQYGSDDFNYFLLDWYQKPKELRQGCWIDPFVNVNPKAKYKTEIITSYSRPVYNQQGRFIGVIAIDLQQKWLSQTVTAVTPYPNSSSIVIGKDGSYFVHPDTDKLIQQTIFSDPDPRAEEDVVYLGKDMIAGNSGVRQLVVDGNDAYIFYRPIGNAEWSTAIVCPASDVFSGYNRLRYTVWFIFWVGLVVILLFCYQTIRGAVNPLKLLAQQAHDIAGGRYDNQLPRSTRSDTIGQLQNSFVEMQQSLSEYISNIQQINREMELRNQELVTANELALESDKKKTAFVQDMMHQIRTPLNIISGFSQVLEENFHELPNEEAKHITYMMQENARKFVRIVRMLVASSDTGHKEEVRKETFNCNQLCREMVDMFRLTSPHTVKLKFKTTVPDSMTISSDKEKVISILTELLDNANKFTQQGIITLVCSQTDPATITFTVTDTGIGIAKADRQLVFSQFVKIDYFTEGIGLGLSLSKRDAQLLGGDLTLDDTYEQGSRFIVTLPVR